MPNLPVLINNGVAYGYAVFSDFRHTKKPPHDITNGRGIFPLSKIVMLCNGFKAQNSCCMH